MATKTVNKTGIVYSRSSKSGWFTMGKTSGGTNQNAQVTFPKLDVPGSIKTVTLYIPWDNNPSGADEGFSATGAMVATVGGAAINFSMSGMSGTAAVNITSGNWSSSGSFVVDLRGRSSASNSTSKGCSQGVYIVVTYDEGTVYYGVNGVWQRCIVFYGVNGQWVQCTVHYGADGIWRPIGG